MLNAIVNNIEYIYNPFALCKRILFPFIDKASLRQIKLSWGHKLLIRACEPVGKAAYLYGVYDLTLSEALFRLTRSTDIAADIGANVGYTTLVFAKKIQAHQIHCFEPHPITFAELQQNMELNHLKVNLYNLALSDKPGTMNLVTANPMHRGGTKLAASDAKSGISMAVHCLDEVIQSKVSIIKIDIEGHELLALQGARHLLGSTVRDILFEGEKSYPNDVTTFLEEQNFKIFRLDKGLRGPILSLPSSSVRFPIEWEPQNWLATKDPDAAVQTMSTRGWTVL